MGNTLIVVEHDEDTMKAANILVDFGPGAGIHGGKVVAIGSPEEVMKNKKSITGDYLSHRRYIPVPEKRRQAIGRLLVKSCKENNLKGIDIEVPIGVFTCVTGVSGSGKSSFVNGILYRALANRLNKAHLRPGKYKGISGTELLDKVILIDLSLIHI